MTKIIGHRGAAGLALENTLPSFQKAVDIGVKFYEFDVHVTADGQFVVCHDDTLSRVSKTNKRIKDLTYAALQEIPLLNDARVPLLSEVLDLARKHHIGVVVEIKIRQQIEELCALLDTYSDLDMTIASFKHDALAKIRRLRPQFRLYLAEGHRPVEILLKARSIKAQGIDLNYKLINPVTYLLAKRWKLQIMVYSVNNVFVERFITFLYPDIAICSDHPERFIEQQ